MVNQIVSWISTKCRRLEPIKHRIRRQFKKNLGYPLNLDNPQTFNEKLNWLKLYDRRPVYTTMVDKVEVKKYVAEKFGGLGINVIPTLGVWRHADEIDFSSLPSQFVVKCSHDFGSIRIIKDKSLLDVDSLKKYLNKRLKTDFYLIGAEWAYKHVKPQILIEPYMGKLDDYKFFCFNGIVKCYEFAFDRTASTCKANYYDRKKKLLDFEHFPFQRDVSISPPFNSVDKMIAIAEELSKDIPFLRVDLYDINGEIYLGELTCYPNAGYGSYKPIEADYELGSWLELPKKHSFFRRKTS